VSFPRFFEIFISFFLNFFKKIIKIATCQAVIVPHGSDSDMCQYYATCHFLSLNLVPLF